MTNISATPRSFQPGQRIVLPRPEHAYPVEDQRTLSLVQTEDRLISTLVGGHRQYVIGYADPLAARTRDQRKLRKVSRELDQRAAAGDRIAANPAWRKSREQIEASARAAIYRPVEPTGAISTANGTRATASTNGKKRTRLSDEDVRAIRQMYEGEGKSFAEIAEHFGCHITTASCIARRKERTAVRD